MQFGALSGHKVSQEEYLVVIRPILLSYRLINVEPATTITTCTLLAGCFYLFPGETRRAWLRSRLNRRSNNGWWIMDSGWWGGGMCRKGGWLTIMQQFLNFLANEWRETHTSESSTVHTHHQSRPNLPVMFQGYHFGDCRSYAELPFFKTLLLHPHLPPCSIILHDKPAFSPAARTNTRTILYPLYLQLHLNIPSSTILLLDTTYQHCPLNSLRYAWCSVTLPHPAILSLHFLPTPT